MTDRNIKGLTTEFAMRPETISDLNDRELDALIAEQVMGLTFKDESYIGGGNKKVKRHCWYKGKKWMYAGDLPNYSTNIADAWLVVEKVLHYDWEIRFVNFNGEWQVDLVNVDVYVASDTAPRAICLAALKAMEMKNED